MDVLLTPSVEVSLEHASGVVHVEDGEFGVGAEEGRGNGADIHAGGAEDGYRHAEGTFAVSAHVVDGRDARDVRAFALIKLGHDSVSFPRTYGPAYGYRVAPVAAGAIAQLGQAQIAPMCGRGAAGGAWRRRIGRQNVAIGACPQLRLSNPSPNNPEMRREFVREGRSRAYYAGAARSYADGAPAP